MKNSTVWGAALLSVGIVITGTTAFAFDETKYPDWRGGWRRIAIPGIVGQPGFDPTKLGGAAQQAPLTAEYQAIFDANVKEQKAGGQGTDPTYTCLSPGMPRVMTTFVPFEILVTPTMTNILIQHIHDSRRIFTDGRNWPEKITPTFVGYSSANGSIPTATDATMFSRWKHAASRVRAPTIRPEFRSTPTTRAFSRSGSTRTNLIPIPCTMKSRYSITPSRGRGR